MSTQSKNYEFEYLEKYHGSINDVKKQIDLCTCCGKKLKLSHLPDYKILIIQETSLCTDCGEDNRKIIQTLNNMLN